MATMRPFFLPPNLSLRWFGGVLATLSFCGRIDFWNSDPSSSQDNAGLLSSANYPGEGVLVYPGSNVGIQGVAPSMRLKWIPDGSDDYDYIELLKQAGQGAFALQIARSVGGD